MYRETVGREPRAKFTYGRIEQGDLGEGRPGRFRVGQRGRKWGPSADWTLPPSPAGPLGRHALSPHFTDGASSSLRPSRFLPDGITGSFLCFPILCYSNILL